MSDVPFPVLVAAVFLFGTLAILHVFMRQQEAQRNLPERDQYLASHGLDSVVCAHCRSIDTREFGINDSGDDRRVVACSQCDKPLFRYTRGTPGSLQNDSA
ncbi:hypothetical protein AzCIB_1567 [Azoarcus sp. CIB]|uniref:hypothetical protein n=1 Tax=Aromatoleum sp. (strain CIB) TaxID=198107 RepID=UPI00067AC657|nr:hypothetical protein [Azoarcus sp. CIB]AKU11468.1 hypothetical protein AzCIB_1567 [Azoarcus sp. CIB]